MARGRGDRQDHRQQRSDRRGSPRNSAAGCSRCRWDSNGSSTDCSAGSLGFGGEESAGASFLRMDGKVWTTDKDGMVPALLAAEMTARLGRDPGELYRAADAGARRALFERVDAPATPEQKKLLARADAAERQIGRARRETRSTRS